MRVIKDYFWVTSIITLSLLSSLVALCLTKSLVIKFDSQSVVRNKFLYHVRLIFTKDSLWGRFFIIIRNWLGSVVASVFDAQHKGVMFYPKCLHKLNFIINASVHCIANPSVLRCQSGLCSASKHKPRLHGRSMPHRFLCGIENGHVYASFGIQLSVRHRFYAE